MAVSADDHSLSVLLLSRNSASDLQRTRSIVESAISGSDIRLCDDVESAMQLIVPDRWYPDLVVVYQHWPDQYSNKNVSELLTMLPLARWICVRGAWCESDGRNGSPWPEAICIREREAGLRIPLECAVLKGEVAALPLTASRDEVFAFDRHGSTMSETPVNGTTGPGVLTLSNDRQWRRAVDDLLAAEGFCPLRPPHPDGALDAIVWDADPSDTSNHRSRPQGLAEVNSERLHQLEAIRQKRPSVVLVAVTTMAYPHDVERLREAGSAAVIDRSQLATALAPALHDALRDVSLPVK